MPAEDDAALAALAALAARLLVDCRALQRRQRLADAALDDLERVLTSLPSSRASVGLSDAQRTVHELLERELGDVVERVRLARNEQQRQSMGSSELAAIAAGGALGALNAWLRPAASSSSGASASTTAKVATATTLWASAYDAAAASLNVVRQRRQVEHVKFSLLSGDPATSTHVLLCINGFMTQSDDPGKNWRAWCREGVVDAPSGRLTAVYAVEWEAGDAAVWSEFCAHVNDKLTDAPVSAVVAHFTGNPWHKAQAKAEQVGVLLAQVIAARPVLFENRELSLLGHSLGGAVIFSVFQELARLQAQRPADDPLPPLVTHAVSFAGAFIPDAVGVANITHALASGGTFLNVFSTRDNVLSKLFWAIHLPGHNDPLAAGCQAIAVEDEQDKVVNVDVSDLIPPSVDNHFGHSYGRHMDLVAQRVLPLLHARRPDST